MSLHIVSVDLDSCLCDTQHRHWMADNIISARKQGRESEYTWEDYSMLCEQDLPIEGTLKIVQLLANTPLDPETIAAGASRAILILSGRHNEALDLTTNWLQTWKVPYNFIRLRRPTDPRSNPEMKKLAMLKMKEDMDCVFDVHIDDSPKVAEAMAEIGVPTLLVNPNYPPGEEYIQSELLTEEHDDAPGPRAGTVLGEQV